MKYLKVKRKEIEEPTMSAKLSNRLIDHTMSAFETIVGINGKHFMRNKYNLALLNHLIIFSLKVFQNRVRSYDKRFLKPILIRNKFKSKDEKLLNTFKKINELNMNKASDNPKFLVVKKAESFKTTDNLK